MPAALVPSDSRCEHAGDREGVWISLAPHHQNSTDT